MRVHYLAKKAEILVTGAGDSFYISVIDSLLVLYPTKNDVITAKYMISQDTTYTIWYEKRCANRAVGSGPSTPIITSFPSPASTSQTVRIENLGEITDIILYDYLGRRIDKSRFSYTRADDNLWLSYNLESGLYILTVHTSDGVIANKVLIRQSGVNTK
jgi:hypothetical protein